MLNKNLKKIMAYFLITLIATVNVIPANAATTTVSGTFKNKSTGPLYFNTYDYQQTNNTYFPENKMKQYVDWLANNFKQYGFEYFTLDGWINTATKHTKNGYITTHSDNWTHNLAYWANYIHSKGLKFGFYYPAFWIHKDVVNDKNAVVEGTNIKVADVVDTTKTFQDWYLVDPDKAGAKEYMEGFINFMKKCGVDYMKIDFLFDYERSMGTEKLTKTLKIISDAAEKDDIFISWSAPNNNDHAKVESAYGDMLRISQDVFGGGWGPFSSNNRGEQFPAGNWPREATGWPEWNNTFDALISYSDLTGNGKIIMDGDFVMAHTFETDAEKKSAVSLPILAGAGFGIADIPEELGEDSAWVYKNREINELNAQGLIGKPLSKVMDSAKNANVDSQIWVGQVKNGDWVVGLFNREDTAQKRSIDFSTLGIKESAEVRDLWAHKSLGKKTSFSTEVEAHGVTVIRISNNKFTSFSDVSKTNEAKKAIDTLAQKAIIDTSSKKFFPLKNIKKGDFVTMLANTLGVSEDYISGYNKNTNSAITREDMMVMAENALTKMGITKAVTSDKKLSAFKDKSQVSKEAVSSICTLLNAGLIKGDGGKLRPLKKATRAEAAVLLYAIYNKLHDM